MRKITLILSILIAATLFSAVVPNPTILRIEDTKTDFEEVLAVYTTRIQFETTQKWWNVTSEAVFCTPELFLASSFEYANQNFLSEPERIVWLMSMIAIYEKNIPFRLSLKSDSYPKTNVINLEASDCKVSNIVLINDKGVKVTANSKTSALPEKIMSVGFITTYLCSNTVTFPHISNTGEKVIDTDTKWIRLWLVTPDYRVYFQYDFE